MTDETNPLARRGKGVASWAGGTDQARDQLHEHCDMLNGKPFVRVQGIEYYVAGETPALRIETRLLPKPMVEPRVTAAQAREIATHTPSKYAWTWVKAFEEGERHARARQARQGY